ncbi:MAG: hypothetical protein QMC79_07960 [Anaerosomatales bacterium]|nr:hypothetical protein [Anaerosomatales bacterium]
MFQPSEIVVLIVSLAMSPIIVTSARRLGAPLGPRIMAVFACVFVAYVATVLEGILLFDLFSFLEHALLTLTGVLLMLGIIAVDRQVRNRREP